MKVNVTYIISNVNKSVAFEWIATHLNKDKFNLEVILMNPHESELENFLKTQNVVVYRIKYSGKKDILKAIFLIYKILRKNLADVVHAHLLDASLAGLISGRLAGVKKRIHTRHHSDYHHVYFPKAVKYDKIVNRLSTNVIAISEVVKNILVSKEKVSPQKISIIHHGFQMKECSHPIETDVNRLKQKYNPVGLFPVIGVISRYTEWKGIQFIIPAFEKLLIRYPSALLVLANATGDYKQEIQRLLQKIPQKNYIEIPFESKVFALYKLFDIFIHVPISPEVEAFGQTYIESLAAGVPLIATKSGIAHEVLVDKHNSLVVPYKNSEAIYESIITLLSNEDLKKSIVSNSFSSVSGKFKLELMLQKLETLYLS